MSRSPSKPLSPSLSSGGTGGTGGSKIPVFAKKPSAPSGLHLGSSSPSSSSSSSSPKNTGPEKPNPFAEPPKVSSPLSSAPKFLCKKVIEAAVGDKGVRCMIRVKETMWGGSRDGLSIEIRETKTGKLLKKLKHPDEGKIQKIITERARLNITSLTHLPEAGVVWSGSSDGTIRVWNTQSETCSHEFKGHVGGVELMKTDRLGNVWTASTDFTIKHWDGRSHFLKVSLLGHSNWVRCFELIPDIKQLWSGSDDGTIRVWDTETGALLEEKAFSDGPLSMILANNHVWIGSRNNVIRVYDIKSAKCVKILTGHKGWVNCLENVGNEIWSGSADRTLRVWNIAEQSCIQKIEGFRGWMYCVASLGNVLWASCSDQKIRVYGITEVKKVAIADDTVEPRQRGVSMSRPRSSTINKKKCVDASSQTTGRVIVVDEGTQVKVRNAEGGDKAEVLSAELLKQIEASGDIENLLNTSMDQLPGFGGRGGEEEDEEDDLSDFSLSDISDTEDLLAATLPAEAIEDIKEELMGEIEAKNRQLEQLHQQLVNLQAALKVSDDNLKRWKEDHGTALTTQKANEESLALKAQVLEETNRSLNERLRKFEEEEMQRLLRDAEAEAEAEAELVRRSAEKPPVHSQESQTDLEERRAVSFLTHDSQTDLTGEVLPVLPITKTAMSTANTQTLSHGLQNLSTQTEEETKEPLLPVKSEQTYGTTQTEEEVREPAPVKSVRLGESQTLLSWQTADAVVNTERRAEFADMSLQTDEPEDQEAEDLSDTESHFSEGVSEKPHDKRLAKLSVVSTGSADSSSDSMLLLCNVCKQHIPFKDLETHSKTCRVQNPTTQEAGWEVLQSDEQGAKRSASEDETLVRELKYEKDEKDREIEGEIKKLELRLEEVQKKLQEGQEKLKKGEVVSDDSLLRLLEEQLRLKEQLIALLRSQKMHAMRRAANFSYQLTFANKEIKRLGAVIHSTHLEEKFETEEEIVRAMLGEDLSHEKIVNFRVSGWLLKRSDNLKIWNKRFFILVDKFLIYYLKKREGLQPRQVCVLNNVVVKTIPDSTINKKCGFRVNTTKHEYLLVASTLNERQIWVEAIEKAGRWWDTDANVSQLQPTIENAAED